MLLSPTGFRLLENPRAARTAPYRADGRDEILSLRRLGRGQARDHLMARLPPDPIAPSDQARGGGGDRRDSLQGRGRTFRHRQLQGARRCLCGFPRSAGGDPQAGSRYDGDVPRPVVRPLCRRDVAHHRDRGHRRQPWPLRRVGCAQFRLPVRHLPAGKHQRRTLSRDRRLRRASQARAGDLRRCGEARGRRCRGATLARRFRHGVRGLHRCPAPRDAGIRA